MQGKRLLHSIRPRNFLSFGPTAEVIELQPLNVLIGPNASGKSNLIEAIRLFKEAPRDLASFVREGDGINECLWKGGIGTPTAELEVVVSPGIGAMPIRHRINFTATGQRLEIVDEAVEDEKPRLPGAPQPFFYYRYQSGRPVLSVQLVQGDPPTSDGNRRDRHLRREDVKPDQSILSQRVDRDQYPEITYLNEELQRIYVFHGINLGPNSEPRKPQSTNLPEDFLEPNASNLAIVLNDLQHRGLKSRLIELMKSFSGSVEDLTIRIYGGSAQIYLHERGLSTPIPAKRLSDGTLRFLCLLAILCHPSPPPLICLEEPEMGQHPDIIRTIAGMLVDASERTQLIVTTHSDHLVSALAGTPEAVIVCEKESGSTRLRRLNAEKLEKWLADYTLGELWMSGEIGGTRW